MPRPLRIEYENAWYHVMNRGGNYQPIVKSDAHRNLFFIVLGEIVDQFRVEIHAYCLMDNHYHLLVKTPYANLSKAMRHLDGVYTQRFNRTSQRDGPLFRGRYKAIVVDSDEYILQVSRYIHLNPVEANICNDPYQFKWSSYRSYINKNLSARWLTTSFILNQTSCSDPHKSYSLFVKQGIDEEIKGFYNKKQLPTILGSKKFIESRLNNLDRSYIPLVQTDINRTKPLPCKDVILNCVMNYFKISYSELNQSIQGKRNICKIISIYLLRKLAHLKHTEIAEQFCNIKKESISSILDRCNKMINEDAIFRGHINKITQCIMKVLDVGT